MAGSAKTCVTRSMPAHHSALLVRCRLGGRAGLIAGELLLVPQVLPGGDLALPQVGPLGPPLLSPSADGSFQPLTPTSGWGGHTQRPWRRGITGPSWSGCGDRVVIGPVQELSGLVTKQSGHRAGSTSAISTARSEAN